MKLIIDVDDKEYEKLKDGHIPFRILDVIQNGMPWVEDLIENYCEERKQGKCPFYAS